MTRTTRKTLVLLALASLAAGCVVKEKAKIPEKSFVAGVPGEVKSAFGPQHTYWITESPAIYQDLAERYRKEGL